MFNAQTHTLNPNQDNKQKQWSSKLFKTLDMTNTQGYPWQMPLGMRSGCLSSLAMM
jgi:hypothetical protein